MATAVPLVVVRTVRFGLRPPGDHRDSAYFTRLTANTVSIVAFIAKQVPQPPSAFEKGGRGFDVVRGVRRQHQRRWAYRAAPL
ncbi:MAG: hypothetical protein EOO77_16670 [Oxalobacteraceae bacterium]|nr:MAG: hypothetical protein EOO77_16670 [Oxalobacteraceae bacterium]